MLIHSWWVFLFGLLCYCGYDVATTKQQAERKALSSEIARCLLKLEKLDERLLEMDDQLASYDDPAYLEGRLMARLGLVPKGQTKVVFKE